MKWKRSLAAFLSALLLLLPACSNRGLPEDTPPDDAESSGEGIDLKEWRSEKQAEAAGGDAEPALPAPKSDAGATDDVPESNAAEPGNSEPSAPAPDTSSAPQAAPTPDTSSAPQAIPTPDAIADTGADDDASETVYVTNTGSKYHRSGCQYLRKSKIPISLSDAKKSYDPCSKCKPPQ